MIEPMNRRNFLLGLGAAVGLVAAEPVRRYWAVGAELSRPVGMPNRYGYLMHESDLDRKGRVFRTSDMSVDRISEGYDSVSYASRDNIGGFTLSEASSLPDFDYDDGPCALAKSTHEFPTVHIFGGSS